MDYFNNTVCYLEPFFQKIQKDKKTIFEYRIPDYVNYRPGSCTKAEEAAKRTLRIWTHHGRELEEIKNEVLALKNTMLRHVK